MNYSYKQSKSENPLDQICEFLNYPTTQSLTLTSSQHEMSMATTRSQIHKRKLKPLQEVNGLDFNVFNIKTSTDRYKKVVDLKTKQNIINGLSVEKDINLYETQINKNDWILGINTLEKFNFHYKNIDNVVKQNSAFHIQDSPLTSMMIKQKMNKQFPNNLNIVKKNQKGKQLKLSCQSYGDNYIDALSEGQKLLPDLDTLLCKKNRITEKSSINLIRSLNQKLINLDLSFNKIGSQGCKQLAEYMIDGQSLLRVINLDQNLLRDHDIDILIQGMSKSKYLKILYLSQNQLSDQSVLHLIELFKLPQFHELYLFWNQIGETGSQLLFKTLSTNKSLKILDLSWNRIQGDQYNFCEFLKNNKDIVHLDMSYNQISYQECVNISEALNFNKTLIGFHFQGNYGFIDNQGFLILETQKNMDKPVKRRIDGCKSLLQTQCNKILTDDKEQQRDICWICDDWRFNKFRYTNESGSEKLESNDIVFINLSIVNYKSMWMDNLTQEGDFQLECMVPYKKCYYCFIVNGVPQIAADQLRIPSRLFIPQVNIGRKNIEINLRHRNYLKLQEQKWSLIDQNYKPFRDYRIRQQIAKQFSYIKIRRKRQWNIRKSNLNEFVMQKDEVFEKCLDFDFANTKIDRVCKSPEELNQIKQYFKPFYKMIIYMYKYFASIQPVGDVWAITINAFWQWIKELEIMNNQFIEADIFLKWQGTLSGNPKGNPKTPDRGIVRHQLIEVIVRMAEQRYFKNGLAKSLLEAVQFLLEQNILPIMNRYNYVEWKNERLLNYQCDKVVCYYKVVIKDLFSRYSKKKSPGNPKLFVSLEELMVNQLLIIQYFQDLCKDSRLFQREQNFTEKEVYFAFNLSKMIEVDEIQGNSTQQLYKNEFIEALGRIAESLSLPMIGDESIEELSYQDRKGLALCIKLESLLNVLLDLCGDETQKYFKKVEKSIFWEKGPYYISTVTEED